MICLIWHTVIGRIADPSELMQCYDGRDYDLLLPMLYSISGDKPSE